jgi:5,6-dimethylbenzimidazole synthase
MDGKHAFSDAERAAVYKCIEARRDVRGEFSSDPIPDAVLAKILRAAHHAPSVGFSQPWNFIVVRSPAIKDLVYRGFRDANEEAADKFAPERSRQYRSLKLEGIREAPLGVCITCDRSRGGEVVLGRTHQPEMDLYSAVCAVQNFWLAARAEGVGVGWMSIIDPQRLRDILGIPTQIVPIAYLCVGRVASFHETPELERRGWGKREALKSLVSIDGWRNGSAHDELSRLL